jgi:hypothetical protein
MATIPKTKALEAVAYCRINLERSKNLFDLFDATRPNQPGKVSNQLADILRASVVFSHAAIDNLLRSFYRSYLLHCSPEQLNAELTNGKVDKLTYGILAGNKHMSVTEILNNAIESYLSSKSFNSIEEVFSYLHKFEIDVNLTSDAKKHLTAMMKRRHLIVHRYDENPKKGKQGAHVALGIRRADVQSWLDSSQAFINGVEKIIKKW